MVNNNLENIKILHIASGDLWAGAEVQLFTLAKELVGNPYIVLTVVLFNHGELERCLNAHNIHVHVIDEHKFNSLIIFRKLLSLLRDLNPDIVHTHRTKENILGSIAAKLAGVSKSIRTVHGAPEHKPPFWKFLKYISSQTDILCGKYLQSCVVAVSSELNDLLRSRFGDGIVTIENGIDMDFNVVASDMVAIPGGKDAIKVCIVCRLVPVKRVDLFIEVAGIFLNEFDDAVEFYIFGDGPLLGECNRLIDASGKAGFIHLMGFQKDMPAWMKKMDLLMIISDHEGLPMNLLEAMSLQLPIISHAVGGITKVLGNGEYGQLIRGQNVGDYVAAFREYLDNCERYIKKAMAGCEFIKNNYSASRNADLYTKLYRTLIRNNN